MPHPKDSELYPIESVVRIKKTGEMAIIKKHVFLYNGQNFLHYEGPIEGRKEGNYAMYHDDLDLEVLPQG